MSILWGPFTFSETDLAPAVPGGDTKAIAVDGTTLPTGVNALSLVFAAGQVRYFGELSGIGIQAVTGSSTPPFHSIWNVTADSGPQASDWTDIATILATQGPPNPLASFTNPNPSGMFHIILEAVWDDGDVQPGWRNFTIQIEGDLPGPTPPAPPVPAQAFYGGYSARQEADASKGLRFIRPIGGRVIR